MSIEDRTMYSVIHQAAEVVRKKYHLSLIGQGGGSDINNKTKNIFAAFQTNYLVTKDQAREIILDIAYLFLEIINNSDHTPYLQYQPFDIKGLEIVIFIHNNDNTTTLDPDLCLVRLSRETIKYCTKDPEKKYGYKSETFEPYEEALQKVKEKYQGNESFLNISYHINLRQNLYFFLDSFCTSI